MSKKTFSATCPFTGRVQKRKTDRSYTHALATRWIVAQDFTRDWSMWLPEGQEPTTLSNITWKKGEMDQRRMVYWVAQVQYKAGEVYYWVYGNEKRPQDGGICSFHGSWDLANKASHAAAGKGSELVRVEAEVVQCVEVTK